MLHIGTTNKDKVREISSLLSPLGIEIAPFSTDVEPEETGTTLIENAEIKARHYALASGGLVLSEDSGIFVNALNGFPGVYSARFYDLYMDTLEISKSNRKREDTDRLNNLKLLALMKDVEMPHRVAEFKVAMVVANKSDVLFRTEVRYPGWIAEKDAGEFGFGYDPVFIGHDTFGMTLAQIDPVRKNLRSHRKKALDELFAWAVVNLDVLI